MYSGIENLHPKMLQHEQTECIRIPNVSEARSICDGGIKSANCKTVNEIKNCDQNH